MTRGRVRSARIQRPRHRVVVVKPIGRFLNLWASLTFCNCRHYDYLDHRTRRLHIRAAPNPERQTA